VRSILQLYAQIVSGKNVTEAVQTLSMLARDRSGSRSDTFSPPQFVVELRMAILPTVRALWESDLVEKAPSEVSERLIEVLKAIATADSEAGALKRSDKPPSPAKPHHKTFKVNEEHLASLTERFSDRELAQEALYRCNNNLNLATDYGREAQQENRPRHPIPEGDVVEPTNSSRPQTGTSTGSATPEYREPPGRPHEYMRPPRVRQVSAGSSEDAAPSLPVPATGEDDPLADVPSLIESISQQMPPPAAQSSDPVAPQNFDFSAILDQMPNSRPVSNGQRASSSSVPQEPLKEDSPVKQG
jgi:E3 ubiquitin-protein ligase HUWE1